MSNARCLTADFSDEETAATWLELVCDAVPGVDGVIEEQRRGRWIAGDREAERTGTRVVLWFEPELLAATRRATRALVAAGWPEPVPDPEAEARAAAGWRAQHRPLDIGEKLRVSPPWSAGQGDPGRVEILIEPGAAFGAGDHATTRLCLEALETLVRPGDRVADFGCGSGVLGLAAVALGAEGAIMVDREPAAVEQAAAEAERNGWAARVETRVGGVAELGEGPFDLILANVFGGRLAALIPELRRRLAPGGRMVLGGILEEHRAAIVAALPAAVERDELGDEGFIALRVRG